MTIKIGHASSDENRKIQGGKVGDNNKREVVIRDYYRHSKGWYLFRPKSVIEANAIAEAMVQACNNDAIGYDQANRLGVITHLKKVGTLGAIKLKTECDCSSLVRACCIQAGFDPGNFTTATEPKKLDESGHFMERIEVTDDTKFYTGDILVTKTKGHTVIIVEGNPRKTEVVKVSKVEVSRFKEDGHGSGTTFKTTTALNLRDGAGTSREVLTTLKQNTKVTWYGFYNKVGATKWYLVKVGNKTGYVSSKYLRRV